MAEACAMVFLVWKAAVLIGILLPALHGFPDSLWLYLFCPIGFLMNLGDLMSRKADGEVFQAGLTARPPVPGGSGGMDLEVAVFPGKKRPR